jgi:hypothetical protein
MPPDAVNATLMATALGHVWPKAIIDTRTGKPSGRAERKRGTERKYAFLFHSPRQWSYTKIRIRTVAEGDPWCQVPMTASRRSR